MTSSRLALDLTLIDSTGDPIGQTRPLLEEFERGYPATVRVTAFSWDDAWNELVKTAIYRHGPDVSQFGTTWISSFQAVRALRPFTDREVLGLDRQPGFVGAAWQSCLGDGGPGSAVWAAPWISDTYILCYRRDLLAQAGLNEGSAFATAERLDASLERLRAGDIPVPWVIPTQGPILSTVHNSATWVWGAGGDFVSPDQRQFCFDRSPAIAGFQAYFRLARHLAPEARSLSSDEARQLFLAGRAAVTIGDVLMLDALRAGRAAPEVLTNLGAVPLPGTPFVGGSNLIVWQHVAADPDRERAALALVSHLTSAKCQSRHFQLSGLLPTRLETLAELSRQDPVFRAVLDSLHNGRSFPSLALWGLVEEQLNSTLGEIWAEVLRVPNINLAQALTDRLTSLARRLQPALVR